MVLLCASIGVGHANPLDMFGSGARGASMGGAQTAASNDASANYYNPALLATLEGTEIDIEYRYALPRLRLNGKDLGVDEARGTRLALAMTGSLAGLKVASGVSAYLPDQSLSRIRSLSEQQPRFVLYDNRPQRIFLGVNFAVQLSEKLSVGGGLGYLTTTQGDLALRGRVGFPDASDSDLRLAIDVDVATLAYPVAGIAYQLRPWLRVAASYRGGVQPTTDLAVNIEGDIGAEGLEPIVADAKVALRSISLSHFQPSEFNAGVDALLSERLRVAADVSYIRWSQFANPAARLDSEFNLGQFTELIEPPEDAVLALTRFHDVVIPRLGVEWLVHRRGSPSEPGREVHLRGGYSYEPSPAPEQIDRTNFIDNDKHTGSLGLGLTLHELSSILVRPISFDGSFAFTSLAERKHRKLSPVDRIGDLRSSGSVWQAILSSRMRF